MPAPVEPGQVIKGKYRIDRILGEDGMGAGRRRIIRSREPCRSRGS